MGRRAMREEWGSVTELERGKRYRLRYWAETPDGYRRCSETVRGTRRDAYDRLAQRRLEHGRDAPCPTVGEVYERWWLPRARARLDDGTLAQSTYGNSRSRWKLDVGATFGDRGCDSIRPLEIQTWLDGMTQKPAADSLALLRQILDIAATYDLVAENVARRKYVMPRRHADRMDGAYTLDQLDAIAQAARGMHTEAAMLLMMFGSCRTGESLGVLLDEVDRAESHGLSLTTAQVVRQVCNDGTISETLKNPQSVRTVVVPPPWGDRLWELAEDARDRGDRWLVDDGCYRPMSQHTLRREWTKATDKAGLPRKQARAARRSWETFMRWDMRIDAAMVESMMGHAIPGVTGRHYDKPTAEMFVGVVAEAFGERPFSRK